MAKKKAEEAIVEKKATKQVSMSKQLWARLKLACLKHTAETGEDITIDQLLTSWADEAGV